MTESLSCAQPAHTSRSTAINSLVPRPIFRMGLGTRLGYFRGSHLKVRIYIIVCMQPSLLALKLHDEVSAVSVGSAAPRSG